MMRSEGDCGDDLGPSWPCSGRSVPWRAAESASLRERPVAIPHCSAPSTSTSMNFLTARTGVSTPSTWRGTPCRAACGARCSRATFTRPLKWRISFARWCRNSKRSAASVSRATGRRQPGGGRGHGQGRRGIRQGGLDADLGFEHSARFTKRGTAAGSQGKPSASSGGTTSCSKPAIPLPRKGCCWAGRAAVRA